MGRPILFRNGPSHFGKTRSQKMVYLDSQHHGACSADCAARTGGGSRIAFSRLVPRNSTSTLRSLRPHVEMAGNETLDAVVHEDLYEPADRSAEHPQHFIHPGG